MKKLALLLVATLTLSSCATLFTGTRDTIRFTSEPSGAMIYKDGVELCRTPCEASVKRDINSVEIEMRLDGYETRVFTLDQEFNVVSVINLGNLLGWGIDILSGSIMRYDRHSYDIELSPRTASAMENAKEIHIDTKEGKVDIYVEAME